jgi:hypothetical protein
MSAISSHVTAIGQAVKVIMRRQDNIKLEIRKIQQQQREHLVSLMAKRTAPWTSDNNLLKYRLTS